jgi:hypothetical protein
MGKTIQFRYSTLRCGVSNLDQTPSCSRLNFDHSLSAAVPCTAPELSKEFNFWINHLPHKGNGKKKNTATCRMFQGFNNSTHSVSVQSLSPLFRSTQGTVKTRMKQKSGIESEFRCEDSNLELQLKLSTSLDLVENTRSCCAPHTTPELNILFAL